LCLPLLPLLHVLPLPQERLCLQERVWLPLLLDIRWLWWLLVTAERVHLDSFRSSACTLLLLLLLWRRLLWSRCQLLPRCRSPCCMQAQTALAAPSSSSSSSSSSGCCCESCLQVLWHSLRAVSGTA
jgi:hypothetical protein